MKSLVLSVVLLACIATICASSIDPNVPFACADDEIYYKCSLEMCFKTCEHLKSPPPCPSLSPQCYEPACLCKDGKLRNKDGVCVHESECD